MPHYDQQEIDDAIPAIHAEIEEARNQLLRLQVDVGHLMSRLATWSRVALGIATAVLGSLVLDIVKLSN